MQGVSENLIVSLSHPRWAKTVAYLGVVIQTIVSLQACPFPLQLPAVCACPTCGPRAGGCVPVSVSAEPGCVHLTWAVPSRLCAVCQVHCHLHIRQSRVLDPPVLRRVYGQSSLHGTGPGISCDGGPHICLSTGWFSTELCWCMSDACCYTGHVLKPYLPVVQPALPQPCAASKRVTHSGGLQVYASPIYETVDTKFGDAKVWTKKNILLRLVYRSNPFSICLEIFPASCQQLAFCGTSYVRPAGATMP